MQTRVIVVGAAVALLVALIAPSEGQLLPAVSVILPIEYGLLKLKAAAIAGLLYLTGGHAGLHFDLGAGPGYGYHHRRRRDTEAVIEKADEVVEEAVVEVKDTSADDIRNYDQLGCGMRLVCELASVPVDELQDDEKLLLTLFGQGSKKEKNTGKFSYVYAEALGRNGDADACVRTYPSCPYQSNQIMAAIRGAKESV